jgi:hypothetical protein
MKAFVILSAFISITPHFAFGAADYAIGADLSFLKRAEDR